MEVGLKVSLLYDMLHGCGQKFMTQTLLIDGLFYPGMPEYSSFRVSEEINDEE
jgi:hypothetical protein